ncbi:hypothetical protein AVEN_120955-1 [Araneus ventricosus]|uniref:Uncharacterized protein n=1 Tax=Araneus ventricosus TaxID=182803 RepID=A0A4Y2EH09_ARAVE|nr:hypothetical protein AVEN_120955-1 [Araneus ventricosus]
MPLSSACCEGSSSSSWANRLCMQSDVFKSGRQAERKVISIQNTQIQALVAYGRFGDTTVPRGCCLICDGVDRLTAGVSFSTDGAGMVSPERTLRTIGLQDSP